MRPYGAFLLGLVLLAGSAIWWTATRSLPGTKPLPPSPPVRVAPPDTTAHPPVSSTETRLGDDLSPEPAPTEPVSPEPTPPLIADAEQAAARVRLLAWGSEAAQKAELAAYLVHPSKDVRIATVASMVLAGDPSFAPTLSRAASAADLDATRSEEANLLRDAAKQLTQNPQDAWNDLGPDRPRFSDLEQNVRTREVPTENVPGSSTK